MRQPRSSQQRSRRTLFLLAWLLLGTGAGRAADIARSDNLVLTGPASPTVVVLQGPVICPKNGDTYYMLSSSSWLDAEAQAVSMAGHLASIADAAEQQWVHATFSNGATRNLWIGLQDAAVEGTFAWTDGTPLAYTNWGPGQPDNFNGNEDYVGMRASDGAWIDVPSDFAGEVYGVVQVNVDGNPLYSVFDVVPATPSNATGPSSWADNTILDLKGNGLGTWAQTNPEQFVYDGGVNIPSSELFTDPAARDGKAFHIHRTAPGASYGPVWGTGLNGGTGRLIDASNGGTFVARIRTSFTSATRGIVLGMTQQNAPQVGTLQVGFGGAQNWLTDLTPDPNVNASPFSSDGLYHVVRASVEVIDSAHHSVRIYYDENPTPIIDEPNLPTPLPGVGNAGARRDEFIFAIWNDQNPVSPGPVGDMWIDWWAGYEGQAVPPATSHPLNDLVARLETPTSGDRCSIGVTPRTTQRLSLAQGASGSVVLTVANTGAAAFNYTVSEVDAFGAPAAYSWIDPGAGAGSPVSVGGSSPFTVNISTAGLSPGVYTGCVKFTPDCNPALSQTRTIELTVVECQWSVSGGINVWICGSPNTYQFTVMNNSGATPVSFIVEEVASNSVTAPVTDYPWLTIDTPGGGPIAPGQTELASVTVNTSTPQVGYIRFTPSCGQTGLGTTPQVREIFAGYHANYVSDTLRNNNLYKIYEYQGAVDPLAANACGPGCAFFIPPNSSFPGNILQGSVEDDPDAVDGKAYRINDTTPTNITVFRTIIEETATSAQNVTDGFLGSTLVARMRVRVNNSSNGMLFINEYLTPRAGTSTGIGFGGPGPSLAGQVEDVYHSASSPPLGITDSGYHLFRLISGFGVYGAKTIKVFVDENPTPVLTISNAATAAPQASDGFGFGIRGLLGDVAWDWVVYTNAGMYEPGQEVACLGRSLIPSGACCTASGCEQKLEADCLAVNGRFQGRGTTCAAETCCPSPFADADEDDDVDGNDFGVFQRCYTGDAASGPLSAECFCFDRNSDGKISVSDFHAFRACSNGSNLPPAAGCE